MTEQLSAVSIWHGVDDPETTIHDPGILRREGDTFTVKIRTKDYRESGLPPKIAGWTLTATTDDGEHLPDYGPGEITKWQQYGGFVRLTVPTRSVIGPAIP